MESIYKLRKLSKEVVDYRCKVEFDRAIEALEAEIAERYMELPLDIDDVPVHVGDTLELNDTRGEVVALMYSPKDSLPWEWQCSSNGEWFNTAYATHSEPRTLEDVLEVFIADYDRWDNCSSGQGRMDERKELFAKYAAEIRELMEVEQ